jgi:hypothetical protein
MNKLSSHLILLLGVCLFSFASSVKDDHWEPFEFFIGNWIGTGTGQPGNGQYERTYALTLGDQFIEVKNKATYPPRDGATHGEIHEDRGFISYDQTAKNFVLRQFHQEGFVNTYRNETISGDGKTIVFVTESIENIPPGWKARETYRIMGKSSFIETFELSEPGKDFFVYSETTFTRQ